MNSHVISAATLAFVLLAGAGCATDPSVARPGSATTSAGASTANEAAQARRAAYLADHPELPATHAAAIRAGELREGMSFNDAVAVLGDPTGFRETRTREGHWGHWSFNPSGVRGAKEVVLTFFNGSLKRWSGW